MPYMYGRRAVVSGRCASACTIVVSRSTDALPGSMQTKPTGATALHSPRQPSPWVPALAACTNPPARTYPRTLDDALGCSSTLVSHASAAMRDGNFSASTGSPAAFTENGAGALAEGMAIIAAGGPASTDGAASLFEHATSMRRSGRAVRTCTPTHYTGFPRQG